MANVANQHVQRRRLVGRLQPFAAIFRCFCLPFFFFNDTATPEIYTLSLHDALPISTCQHTLLDGPVGVSEQLIAHHLRKALYRPARWVLGQRAEDLARGLPLVRGREYVFHSHPERSEEHTSELQSHSDLVCRLLLEK